MRRTAAAPALALALALTACNGGDDPSTVETTAPPTTALSSTTAPASTTPSSTCPAAPALPAGATEVTATVAGGKVTTAHDTWSVKTGSQVRVSVTADVADEVHVHTYDKKQDTDPGCPTAIDFTATIPGTHEVELEEAGLELFTIKVG